MENVINVLLVEDSDKDANLIQNYLSHSYPFFEGKVKHARSAKQATDILDKNTDKSDVILLDLNLPDARGLESLDTFTRFKDIPIIVVTGDKDMELGYKAIKHGASDFLFKSDLDPTHLTKAIYYSLARHELKASKKRISNELVQSEISVNQLESQKKELSEAKKTLMDLTSNLSIEKESALKASSRLKEANELLEKKNSEIEQYVFAVSHDLKAPLVSITGFAKMALSEISDQYEGTVTHSLRRILSNTKSMDVMLKDLLNLYSVLYSEPKLDKINLATFMKEILEKLDDHISHSQAVIKIENEVEHLRANRHLLSQCLCNLVMNSIQYRSQDRDLHIEIRTYQFNTDTVITVKDSGMGIPLEYQHRIFDLFERLDQKKSGTEGTGIGLAIVKSAVERHKGKIEVDSDCDRGSTFTIRLPSNKNTPERASGQNISPR